MKKAREGYKLTEIGEIPKEWEVKKLGEVTKLIKDGTHNPPKGIEKGIPMLSAENIFNNKINFGLNEKYISTEDYNIMHKSYEIEYGDVLMTIVGTIGRTAVVDIKDKFTVQRSVAILRPNENLNSKYLNYTLNTNYIKKQIIQKANITAQAGIYLGELSKLTIIIPPLPEQQKIADILSTVDEEIENVDKLIEKSKELKKGLMQRLLTKGIGHKEFKKTEIGVIPKEWEVKKLCEVSKIRRGASPRPISDMRWFSHKSNIGWIRISDVTKQGKYIYKTEQYLSNEGVSKSVLVKKDNLIMSICATVGKPTILKMDCCIHDGFVVFDELSKKIYIEYLYYYLDKYQEHFKKVGQIGTQMNLNTDLVNDIIIPIPPISKQQKIADILSAVDDQLEEYQAKKEKLELLKKGLMQKLLTGKIRVKV
jgi:type I restriction enzyme S subunit